MSASERRRTVVVGGGLLGMRLAQRLAAAGDHVTLLEAAPALGGLASAWRLGDGPDEVTWDRHYHVTLTSDTHTRALYADLGLDAGAVWKAVRADVVAGGRRSPCSSAMDYLRLPFLSPLAKARLAVTILRGATVRDLRALEAEPVTGWLRRWSGRPATERLWGPLLAAKLGANADIASAAFIVATIQRLFRARRQGLSADLFGYVPGGYARVLTRYAEVLEAAGVRVVTEARVERVLRDGGGLRVDAGGTSYQADDVVVTAAAPLAAQMCPELNDSEVERLEGVTYQGIVCASVLLRRPLAGAYLTYLTDPAPFTAVVEMTALVDAAELGGRHLVYLPRYVAADDPFLVAGDEQVRAAFLPALRRLHPDLVDDDVLSFQVSRVRHVLPVPTLGYSDRLPPLATSLPGLWLVSSAQITDGTLNADETLALADRAVPLIRATDHQPNRTAA